jgi:hypothetical protein
MTDYRATPERWQNIENAVEIASRSIQWVVSDEAACLLELRARVEALEANSTPTPRQIRSSLVERVHSCIVGEPECGHMQARAAIREVLAYMCEHELIGNYARQQIEQEAEI